MSDDDRKHMAALLRRANKARHFPVNTCAASRHALLIARQLANRRIPIEHIMDGEREHIAVSIAATVAALWEARSAKG